jgi:RNA polymerase sigma-70 factor (ECF subfamily)
VELGDQLFRRESGRLVAALTRVFGLDNLALAEDVVQDVFCRALEVWKLRGIPQHPSAWLMTAAKNRAIDLLRRERTARNLVPELGRLLESEWTMVPTLNGLFDVETIDDDRLRMMFSCCDPRLPEQTQITLTLHLLCGFTASEIANSFMSTRAAIEKRIERGKSVLAGSKNLFDLADEQLFARLSAVRGSLYLLFNEGYHGGSAPSPIRVELCREAMRLAELLLANRVTATPESYALCALMRLHAARLPARLSGAGDLIALADQDRSRWDSTSIAKGNAFLERSATGAELSAYHVEAAIAALHSNARQPEDTNWTTIVELYDVLIKLRPSPVVALNRAIAIAQRSGPLRGLAEIDAIPERDRLASYPFLPAALGELELRAGRPQAACEHFRAAAALARNPAERQFLERRAEAAASP